MNNGFLKGVLLIAVIAYIISPVDLCVGPVDDLIVLLLGFCARRKLSEKVAE